MSDTEFAAQPCHQARRPCAALRRRQDQRSDRACRRGQRRVRRGCGDVPVRAGSDAAPACAGRGDAAHRADPGCGGSRALRRRPPAHAARLHRLPRAAPPAAGRAQHAGRRAGDDGRIPAAARLARQRQRQPGLVAGRADPQRVGQGGGQLLARPCLPAGGRARAPRGRPAHPRPGHAQRLLRRLVAAHAAARGPERHTRQGGIRAAAAPVERGRADRQLPRHAAERMGWRAGLQLLRYLSRALRAQGRAELRAGAPVHPGADLQPERALALGHADAVHQPDLRLGLPRRPARAGAGHWRQGDAVQLRRAAERDGPDQPRLHRGDDRPATPRGACSPFRSPPTTSPRISTGTARMPRRCSR